MFRNIGSKLKSLAYICTAAGMIASIIYGILSMPAGIFAILLGCLLSWVGSFALYGIGQLVENSERLLRLLDQTDAQTDAVAAAVTPAKAARKPWVCVSCGTENGAQIGYCVNCGTNRGWSEDQRRKKETQE